MPRRTPRNAARLATFVDHAMKAKGLTSKTVETRAKRYGHKITDETVRNVLNGSAKNLTIDRLEALAVGLDEPFQDLLFAAADITPQGKESFRDSVLFKLYLKSEDENTPDDERTLIKVVTEMLSERLRSKGLG